MKSPTYPQRAVVRDGVFYFEDGSEVNLLIDGQTLPSYHAPKSDEGGDKQQVIRPESAPRVPGLVEGERPQPA